MAKFKEITIKLQIDTDQFTLDKAIIWDPEQESIQELIHRVNDTCKEYLDPVVKDPAFNWR